jgi:hypothetical protein
MRIKTAVDHLPLADGGHYKRPGGILVDERGARLAPGRTRGNLYILAELSGEEAGRNIIAMQLTEAIRGVYYRWRGSITAGLQESIREANRLLFGENRNALPGERRTAGVSCVVLRGNDLFVAQAGPAAVHLTCGGEVARFPDRSPWLDHIPLEEMDAAPLGDRRDVNVSLFHTQVSHGDTILLVQSATASQVPANAWPRILRRPSVEEVLLALSEVGRAGDLMALAIKLGDERDRRYQASAVVSSDEPGPSESPIPPIQEQAPQWAESIRLGEWLRAVGKALVAALIGLGAALLTLFRRLVPGQLASQPASGVQDAAVEQPERPPPRPRATPATNATMQRVLIGVAIAIPLIVAAIVLVTYFQRAQVQGADLEALWLEASARWQQVQVTSDPAAVRTLLDETEGYLLQLLDRRPGHAEAVDLLGKVHARQDEINQVRRITWLGELQTYPAGADLSRVVIQGVHVFVMDRNAGKVYHHQMDEYQQALTPESKGTVLVSKGDQVGEVLVADLVDMAWMPAGNERRKANLLILESGGSLIEYDPATGERAPLRLAASEQWQYPRLVGSYYGRFYVLDPNANQIVRYQPTPDGYSAPPDQWLQAQVDLAGVVDMAIGNSIYLLYADGKLRKLTAGQPDAFDISDWDMPPSNPTALFTRPPEETQWVYVADRGNGRIVQVSKEGHFRRQFRMADEHLGDGSDPLAGVTSLFVDEISGHAYFVSNQKLYLAILPD